MCVVTANGSQFRTQAAIRSGFTLIEVMIVVVLLGIVAMLVLPSAGTDEETRVAAAARMLIADIEYAQLGSIGNGIDPCVVVFDTVAHSYRIARQTDPATPIDNPSLDEPYERTFGAGSAEWLKGVEFDSLSVGGDDELSFTHLGALDQGTAATITLRCGAATLMITVDPYTGEPSAP